MNIKGIHFVAFVCLFVAFAPFAKAQTYTIRPVQIISDYPAITITTGTATTAATPTAGMHMASVQFNFGTVTGTYTTCTVQAQTSIDGTNFLTLGSAVSVTATSNTKNAWQVGEGTATTASTTVSQTFGLLTKFAFACSGAYGTSAPVTVSVTYAPLQAATAGGGGGGGAVTVADGADTAEGATTDAATAAGGAGSVSAKLREISSQLNSPLAVTNTNLDVALSTRLKPADTLTAVTTVGTITNPVTVTGAVTATGCGSGTCTETVVQFTPGNFNGTFVGSLGNNGAPATTNRVGTLPAVAQSNIQAAAIPGRDAALETDLNHTLRTGQFPIGLNTYVAVGSGTLFTGPTDIAVLPGNATNTVVVSKVLVSCTQTAAAINDIYLVKRSTADTAGTSTAMPVIPLDSGNQAGVSAPLFYTVNPTMGTAVGGAGAAFDRQKTGFNLATGANSDFYMWTPGVGQSITLRGTAQQLAVNLNGQTTTGAVCDVQFTWIETTGL